MKQHAAVTCAEGDTVCTGTRHGVLANTTALKQGGAYLHSSTGSGMPDAAATHRAYGSLADGVHAAARARFSQDHRWVNLPFGEDKPLSVGRCVLSDQTGAHRYRARGSSSKRARASESVVVVVGGSWPGEGARVSREEGVSCGAQLGRCECRWDSGARHNRHV